MFTTPHWEHVTQRVQTKIFVFSRQFSCYNRVSVTTNMTNSGLLVRIQDGDEENSAVRRKLTVNKGQFCDCVGTHWKQIDVKRWGFIIPRWNLPGLFTWCKGKAFWIPSDSRNILEFLRRPEVTGHYKKIPPLYLWKNVLATTGNLKVNEQTKYKSVPIFLLFLAVERKPEIRNYWFLSLRYKSKITP